MKSPFLIAVVYGMLLLQSSFLFAQEGDLFLYNYDIPLKNIDNQNFAAIQGNNGTMYFANKKGVLTYDGVSWELIPTLNSPYALEQDQKGTIYVGCRDNFGYLNKEVTGKEKYVSVSGNLKGFGEITRIFIVEDQLYFYSDKVLFQWSVKEKKITKQWKSTPEDEFSGIALIQSMIYLNFKKKGLHSLKNGQWLKTRNGEKLGESYIETSLNYGFLGMSDNQLYVMKNGILVEFNSPLKDYIKGNIVTHSSEINKETLALGTLSGGMLLLNKNTGEVISVINYQTGLPDDEVFAICTDKQSGIWICHANGISRADQAIPLRNFSGFPGLDGNLLSLYQFKDTLYVATGDGVFYLCKVNYYEEIESKVRKEQKYLKTVERITRTITVSEPNRDNRIRRYEMSTAGKKEERRRISIDEQKEVKKIPSRALSVEISTSFFRNPEAKKAYALQSIPYIFKKVIDVDAKCRQFLEYDGRILLATNIGLFELKKDGKFLRAVPIIRNEYIHFISQSEEFHGFLYVCTGQGLRVMALEKGNWKTLDQQKSPKTAIYSVMEDKNTLWLGAENRVLRVQVDTAGALGTFRSYVFDEGYSENVLVREIDNKPVFIFNKGIYSFDRKKDKITRDADLQKYFNPTSAVFFNQANYTWIKNYHWQNLNAPRGKEALNTVYLELFKDLRDIYVDNAHFLWVIDNQKIYRINPTVKPEKASLEIFLKSVRDKEGKNLPLDRLKVDFNQNALSFTFQMASPFYRNEKDIQFQYWLEGLTTEWTTWDNKAIISFPYIPSGNFLLHVKARNVLGQTSEEKIFPFVIHPPFWQTYWFYALQIGILLSLLYVSYLFNRSGRLSRISLIITIVSIITLFEFISMLVEPYVDNFANGIPVFKLLMNIFLAISLFPIERVIRKFLQRPAKRVLTNLVSEGEVAERED